MDNDSVKLLDIGNAQTVKIDNVRDVDELASVLRLVYAIFPQLMNGECARLIVSSSGGMSRLFLDAARRWCLGGGFKTSRDWSGSRDWTQDLQGSSSNSMRPQQIASSRTAQSRPKTAVSDTEGRLADGGDSLMQISMDEGCRWPDLPERYAIALRDAVSFVLDRFNVAGIVAAGSILRGTPDLTSDLDIYVVNRELLRHGRKVFLRMRIDRLHR